MRCIYRFANICFLSFFSSFAHHFDPWPLLGSQGVVFFCPFRVRNAQAKKNGNGLGHMKATNQHEMSGLYHLLSCTHLPTVMLCAGLFLLSAGWHGFNDAANFRFTPFFYFWLF